MMDKTSYLQIIECIKCGDRRREVWLSRESLQKKEEGKEMRSSSERVRKGNAGLMQWNEQEEYGELKIRLEL
jgi:hypothetical protein